VGDFQDWAGRGKLLLAVEVSEGYDLKEGLDTLEVLVTRDKG
jgi:hypothetical protein